MRTRQTAIMAVLTTALLLAMPVSAFALTWSEGGKTPFSGTLTGLTALTGSNTNYLVLPVERKGSALLGSSLGVRATSVMPQDNGRLLVTDANRRRVVLFDADSKPVWTFSVTDDPTLIEPYFAQRTWKNTTLVVDRAGDQVIEVDNKDPDVIVWRSKLTGTDSTGTALPLDMPHSAQLTKDGTVLIADAGKNRVIEVKKTGHAGGKIVWQYGKTGSGGSKDGYLRFPTSAQRLENNTLITDQDAHRIVEVTPKKKIAWSYGVKDTNGSTLTMLNAPSSAYRDSKGVTLVADTKNSRVLRVAKTGTLSITDDLWDPITARPVGSGLLLVADSNARAGALYSFGHTSNGRYDSGSINMTAPGLRKWVKKISVSASVPKDTDMVLQYAFDGGSWKTAKGLSVKWSGKGRRCTYMRVRVKLTSDKSSATPVLKTISVNYQLADTTGSTGSSTNSASSGTWFGPTGPTGGSGTGSGPGVTGGGSGEPDAAIKSGGGASTMLPSGTSPELRGANMIHSGYVMDHVTSEMPGQGASVNQPALSVDAVGAVTAGVLLSTFYTLGLAGPQLSHAVSGAWGALRTIVLGRMHG